jgi:hypothetical protein
MTIKDVAVNNGDTIFVSVYNFKIYMSSNNGINWVETGNGFKFPSTPHILQINNFGTIFVGTYWDGVYKSTDNGNNWIYTSGFPVHTGVTSIATTNGDSVYAIANDQSSSLNKLYKSIDNGNNWTFLNDIPGPLANDMIVDTLGIIFVANNDGIIASYNDGIDWTTTLQEAGVNFSSFSITDNNKLFCGSNNGVYIYDREEQNWKSFINEGLDDIDIWSLAIDHSQEILFAGAQTGVFQICGGDGIDEDACDCDGNIDLGCGCGVDDSCLAIDELVISNNYSISSIHPNPFNPTTTISFSIPEFGLTTITAYDINGRELETLTNEVLSIGNYSLSWNASNYPSGVYLIRMESGDFTQTQKVVLVK